MPEETDYVDVGKLIQQAMHYPQLGVDINPEGATLLIVLGPATAITQGVDEKTMDDICERWRNRHAEP